MLTDVPTATAASRRQAAAEIMLRFAERTGLTSARPQRRYLWTDAFAVCNFLGLAMPELALRLVERVHGVLGRHRDDDARTGWLSGLDAGAGEAHPTRGGLRIGKPLPERRAGEPPDEQLEWDRDGQYFHYLTKWMHALARVSETTGQAMFRTWACELAATAHAHFVYTPRAGAAKRMYWKMSIDLSRPLVASMGQHDPLDGLLTCSELGLASQAADFASMLDPRALATDDPLGLGGLLVDAQRAERLHLTDLARAIRSAAEVGLRHHLARPAGRGRLAFRELGLTIGLAAAGVLPALRAQLEDHWLRTMQRRTADHAAHEDINEVMLATSLVPEGFLGT